MDAIQMIKERRSVRKFEDKSVDRETITEILSLATTSPTWANSQIVRYTIVDSEEQFSKIVNEGFGDFKFNANTVSSAAGVIVVSMVKGLSGRSPQGELVTSKGDRWEMFDAGIASQTLSLAAYEKGIGTVILGLFDEVKLAEIIDLPADETIAAVIPYGYELEHPKATPRKPVAEVVRYL